MCSHRFDLLRLCRLGPTVIATRPAVPKRWGSSAEISPKQASHADRRYSVAEERQKIQKQPTDLNLSLFGPPGSGKGSYGKHFAKALGIPLVTTSDVLRKLRPDLLASMADGKLVDDSLVGATVLEGLQNLETEAATVVANSSRDDSADNSQQVRFSVPSSHHHAHHKPGYILDGFPRTLAQVELMESTWPEALRLRTLVHLEVPDFVSARKLLGRRACSRCGASYNVHGVHQDGWILPPQLPSQNHTCPGAPPGSPCDWDLRREDDTPEVVRERLNVYHQHADPILDYIRNNSRNIPKQSDNNVDKQPRYSLLTLKPYRGFDDLPKLVEALCNHVSGNDH